MRRHEIDAVSLVAGLLFLVVAGVHIVARATDTDLNLRWMVPAVLVLLGVLGLLSAVRSPRHDRVSRVPSQVAADGTDAERAEEVDGDFAAAVIPGGERSAILTAAVVSTGSDGGIRQVARAANGSGL